MADLGLINSKLGLYIKINVNNGQNKFEVHISKNVAKMAILWPKIGQRHFGARASHGHNLAIFHQILTNEHTKMTSSLRRIEWNQILSSISLFYILVFWLHFCSEASHGQRCTYGLKTTLKLLVHVLAIMASSYLKIVFLQKSGLNPPPLKPRIFHFSLVKSVCSPVLGSLRYGQFHRDLQDKIGIFLTLSMSPDQILPNYKKLCFLICSKFCHLTS